MLKCRYDADEVLAEDDWLDKSLELLEVSVLEELLPEEEPVESLELLELLELPEFDELPEPSEEDPEDESLPLEDESDEFEVELKLFVEEASLASWTESPFVDWPFTESVVSALSCLESDSLDADSLDCVSCDSLVEEDASVVVACVCALVVDEESTSVLPQPCPPVISITRPAVMAMATRATTTETIIARRCTCVLCARLLRALMSELRAEASRRELDPCAVEELATACCMGSWLVPPMTAVPCAVLA